MVVSIWLVARYVGPGESHGVFLATSSRGNCCLVNIERCQWLTALVRFPQASIRVVNSKGNPGISLGEWMINQGLDTPKLRVSKCIEKEPRRLPKRHASSIDRKKPVRSNHQ